MQFLTTSAWQHEPPHVLIHGPLRTGVRLLLAAEPGSPTPAPLRAATVTEQAIRFVQAEALTVDGPAESVGASRFDGTGLLAVWALLNPASAVSLRREAIDAARAATFHIGDSLETAAFVCTINAYLHPHDSPLAGTLAPGAGLAGADSLYETLLPLTEPLLRRPREFDLLWIGEYSDVLQSRALSDSGAVQVEHDAELDLAVLDTPLSLHPLIQYTLTQGRSRLLTVRSENTYTLEYRRESWAWPSLFGYLPRLRLGPLATRLNLFERNEGRWRAQPVELPAPLLFLDDGRGRPSPSSIDRETWVAEVVAFLRAHRRDAASLWDHQPGVQ